jgi:hypothetical protein
MKYLKLSGAVLAIAVMNSCASSEAKQEKKMGLEYPETRKDTSVIEDYFGTAVSDPIAGWKTIALQRRKIGCRQRTS